MAIRVNTKRKKTKKKKSPSSRTEMTRLGGALRALGGLAGGTVGSLIGMRGSGASMGTGLGATLSRWLGSGDYTVGSNTIVQRTLHGSESIPAMHSNNQTVTIRHKEYIGEVKGNQAFTVVEAFQLNPGNYRSFPWLSGVASRFQEYRIKGMVYHYIPSSGSAVSSSDAALGTVMMVTTYRASDLAPTSKVEMLNEYWSSESVPCNEFCHPIECDPKENPYNVQYVRTGEVPAGDSRMLYDLGITYLATSGQQVSGRVLGDLWVTYEVELKKPIVASNVTSTVMNHNARYLSMGAGSISTNLFPGNLEGVFGDLGVALFDRTIRFPRGTVGYFHIVMRYFAGGAFTYTTPFSAPTYSGCVSARYAMNADIFRIFSDGDECIMEFGVLIVDPSVDATIVFNAVNIPYTTSLITTITVEPYSAS